ncbi:hypothetical protein J6X15_03290 [Candidatus Saccharibacteria bacterium]|nr:hypothetical protein [Candidatus Saccharibacteria bacterium]
MSKKGYVAFYGTVGMAMRQLVQILYERSFAMVTESSYQDWLKTKDFIDEYSEEIRCNDDVVRQRSVASFSDKNQTWEVTTYKCPHPYLPDTEGWRFVERVKLDNAELAESLLTVEEFIVILKKKTKIPE